MKGVLQRNDDVGFGVVAWGCEVNKWNHGGILISGGGFVNGNRETGLSAESAKNTKKQPRHPQHHLCALCVLSRTIFR
jgi:hypothetical protein